MTRNAASVMLALLALPLAACGDGAGGGGNDMAAANTAAPATEPGDKSLTAALDGDASTIGDLAKAAGLGTALGGVGPYTIFAPRNAAFDALGKDRVEELKGEGMRAQAASLVTAHIVPGLVTAADLQKAVASGKAEMTTMAGGTLSFARDGDAIVVKTADGRSARLVGGETLASNGAIHPIDGLLVPMDGAGQ
ncbi:fasciclin domain-containing protein [Allosphingosinicella flava]|uniref:Fasciclin domain-containing protein n=1 Tax=Allosphingosinicella flava TaxID=2771430 RepID=A0A7T2LLB3_9SPHN|nr:fasciclin domain-containing protein [Sphingosinicella flava]QPQ54326.1 fasciclin domain-containing protein [Sphingosinicella flava]